MQVIQRKSTLFFFHQIYSFYGFGEKKVYAGMCWANEKCMGCVRRMHAMKNKRFVRGVWKGVFSRALFSFLLLLKVSFDFQWMWGGFENSAKHVVRAFGGLLAFEGNRLFFESFCSLWCL